MRRRLLGTFDEIYILNLHGNSRKKEVAPDGGKDENVFNIMQGVAITLFVKCKGSTGLTRLTGLKDETKNLVNPVNPVKESPTPEDIFDYIYGVLHSPAYRTKFKEFLKVDFPRIPYPKDLGEFERFRAAGRELRAVHLMKDAEPSLSEARGRFPIAGDNVVDTVRFEIIGDNFNTETKPLSESQCLCASVLKKSGRVYINSSQYFDNVPLEAWGQAIGGYRPAEKYLKDRKNRALSQEELKHYQRIILALAKTREIMDRL